MMIKSEVEGSSESEYYPSDSETDSWDYEVNNLVFI